MYLHPLENLLEKADDTNDEDLEFSLDGGSITAMTPTSFFSACWENTMTLDLLEFF